MIPNKSFINNLITFILIPYFIIENEIKRRMCAKFQGFLVVRTILVLTFHMLQWHSKTVLRQACISHGICHIYTVLQPFHRVTENSEPVLLVYGCTALRPQCC